MAGRIVALSAIPFKQARAEAVAAIQETDGNFCRAAFVLGVSRRQLYRYAWDWDLWSEVDRARAAAVDSLNARRAALVGRRRRR